jgi:hypothetical protein
MRGNVVFEEGQGFDPMPLPRPDPPTIEGSLMNAGIVGSRTDAMIILAIAALIVIGLSLYLLITSVQPAPSLGPDQLLPGEVPGYPAH